MPSGLRSTNRMAGRGFDCASGRHAESGTGLTETPEVSGVRSIVARRAEQLGLSTYELGLDFLNVPMQHFCL